MVLKSFNFIKTVLFLTINFPFLHWLNYEKKIKIKIFTHSTKSSFLFTIFTIKQLLKVISKKQNWTECSTTR